MSILPYLFALSSFFNSTEDSFVENISLTDTTMIFVEGGTFQMGSENGRDHEMPVHEVTVSDFYISKYEVTVAEYMEFVKAVGKHHPEWLEPNGRYNINTGFDDSYKEMGESLTAPNHPIVGVSWHDANAYCKWLSEKEGFSYRLPTEAEWEFAARGGNESKGYLYAGGDVLEDVAWQRTNSGEQTHPVGQKMPNELGVYDMSGNVCEWCSDEYGEYPATPQTNPTGPITGGSIIFRGGGKTNWPEQCTVSHRNDNSKMARIKGIGFRVVRS